jgi:P-type Ca2+ transporter type 2C
MSHADTPVHGALPSRAWHTVPVEDLASELGADLEHGLTDEEAERRRQRFGPNRLSPRAGRSALARLASQLNNLFIYLLLFAAVVTAMLGEWLDSGVILGVVVIIVLIGFIQEGRAERALEAVSGMLTPRAQVVRGGRRRVRSSEELVPGDLVILDAGDGIPADIRVIHARNLQAQEAALTGESIAVEKSPEPVAADVPLGDRTGMVYSGTMATAGRGKGIVVATGDATELGRISGMLSEIKTLKTPLMQRLDAFTRILSVAILALALAAFIIGVFVWGRAWPEMFFAAVSIAVAAIPEGLPAVMTVTLAMGVQRMARRNAIIRRLPAVETLGAVTTICSDKTGTLTRNEMTARSVRTADHHFEVEGVGYEPHGEFLLEGSAVALDEHATALELIRAAMLCNDAELHHDGQAWQPAGDPTELALVVLAHKAGLEPELEKPASPRLDVIPFASERRYMATLNRHKGGQHSIYVKGAPERVLGMCSRERHIGEVVALDPGYWLRQADEIAQHGQRVLAIARKDLSGKPSSLSEADAEQDLVLLGLVGLIDPPREEAIRAVATCRRAGIRVKMITGDHALTAEAIAAELGLQNPTGSLTGRDLERIDDQALCRQAMQVDVFARTSPEDKLRLVTALQAEGAVTAMTGDGVNDAPALKRADIGIAMGQKGTDAAREAAEMVLVDDNFASIERAIEEGRAVYDNVKKAILFILPTNVAQAFVIVAAILLGAVLPVTPVQILWVNMITAVTLGIALAWERAEGDIMQRPPRDPKEPLLTGFMLWRIGFVGLILLLGVGLLFMQEMGRGETSLAYARTLAVNALVMGQIAYVLNARFFFAPSWTLDGLFGSRMLLLAIGACLGLQLLFTYAPFMNRLFDTEALTATGWARCLALALAVFALVEIEKAALRGRRSR